MRYLNFRVTRMEAVAQICDAHLTSLFQLGSNNTGREIIDILREVMKINSYVRI